MEQVLWAFLLTTLAGVSTGVGALFAFVTREVNLRFLSVCTGVSAGVMIYVAFMEILPHGMGEMVRTVGVQWGEAFGAVAFFGGMGVTFLIDKLVPEEKNPHQTHPAEAYEPLHHPERRVGVERPGHLLRTGILTALAITIHNFPEGLATFLTALENPGLGVAVALAIALHNIPEGISVAVPIYYATGRRGRAFGYACLSGFAEPVGAVVLWGVMAVCYRAVVFTPPAVLVGGVSAAVAGVMVFISIDELLPTSRRYGRGHDSICGFVLGMGVMAVSLLVLR